MIQTDAPTATGSSGGALCDVVGGRGGDDDGDRDRRRRGGERARVRDPGRHRCGPSSTTSSPPASPVTPGSASRARIWIPTNAEDDGRHGGAKVTKVVDDSPASGAGLQFRRRDHRPRRCAGRVDVGVRRRATRPSPGRLDHGGDHPRRRTADDAMDHPRREAARLSNTTTPATMPPSQRRRRSAERDLLAALRADRGPRRGPVTGDVGLFVAEGRHPTRRLQAIVGDHPRMHRVRQPARAVRSWRSSRHRNHANRRDALGHAHAAARRRARAS